MAAGKSFEVVFVSSDRDDAQFDEYYGTHPWAAVPFANRDAKNALSRKFKVQGIPTFVLVDGETGEPNCTHWSVASSGCVSATESKFTQDIAPCLHDLSYSESFYDPRVRPWYEHAMAEQPERPRTCLCAAKHPPVGGQPRRPARHGTGTRRQRCAI